VIALQISSTRAGVSNLNPPSPPPVASADTITNSLAPFPNSGVKAAVYTAASTGNIPDYNEPSCQGAGIQSGNYGEAIAAAGLKAVPVVGGILSTVVGAFGAHHAAAVKQEQAILCAEVPGIQAFLRSIDAAVFQGGADTGAATQAMESAYSTFVSRTSPIFKTCNAACDYRKYVRAAIEYRKLNYSMRTASQESAAQGVLGGAVSGAASSFVGAVSSVFTGATPYTPLPIATGLPVALPGQSVVVPAGGGDYSAGFVGAPPPATVLQQVGLTPTPQSSAVWLIGGLLLSAVVLSKLLGR
jgi:hypothetical protein